MIRINLLPYREKKKKENVRRQASIFFLSFILFLLILYAVQSFLVGKIDRMKAKLSATKTELAKYDQINKEIDEIVKKLDILKKKTTVINNLQMERHKAVQLLDVMTQTIVSKRMWFTNLSSNVDTVSIVGIALDNKTVADFMTRLEKTDLFSAVNLKSIRQEALRDRNINLKKFEIACAKILPAPPKAGEETKKK